MNILYLLAALIASECSICDTEEQMLIGSVVLNRSRNRNLSIPKVIYQKHQFHAVNTKNFKPTFKSLETAAHLLIQGPTDSTVNYFYLRDSPHNTWRESLQVVYKCQYHNICR